MTCKEAGRKGAARRMAGREIDLPRRATGGPNRYSNQRLWTRRALKARIADLIASDPDGDIIDHLPSIATALDLTVAECRFELGWQLGVYDEESS